MHPFGQYLPLKYAMPMMETALETPNDSSIKSTTDQKRSFEIQVAEMTHYLLRRGAR
jgi:hypothetical protein